MDLRDVRAIRATIANARHQEAHSGHLQALLGQRLPHLHTAIRLPETEANAALLQFVLRYIEHIPDFIEAISLLTERARVFAYAEHFLTIASDYFLSPPEVIDGHHGLQALLDEAYLAHRLMEEINDRFIAHAGAPLLPMDMTRANLIVHHLLGDRFANKLDQVVQFSVDTALQKERLFQSDAFHAFLQQCQSAEWAMQLSEWPCLTEQLDIGLDFGKPTSRDTTPRHH
ncbi:hypothetical protein [Pseudomaricurvus sp. HS19]|uniref:hypothetical protein n=1 Tax=Pseudomaricurvus sp. HS19 TaxID=2692626 RepID=UPI00136F7707|nr:hypothetical protein [Pseudomaricurvus sp. HS19]MYM63737.1 hypothetical protein [Pseudomaricurvus sp. HS19]